MSKRKKQLSMLAKEKSAYGGDLLKTRAGRRHGRPLSTRQTMHLVLRSTKARGEWSFRKSRNEAHVNRIVDKFAVTYGVRVISMANVGNHLHLQIKLTNRFTYKPFIRAITAAIAMAVTGRSRWTRPKAQVLPASKGLEGSKGSKGSKDLEDLEERKVSEQQCVPGEISVHREKFWDYRPYTRVVESFKEWLTLNDYIRINQFEGAGYSRDDARFMLKAERRFDRSVD
jgi:REP element-mobilizing transposase RayT